MYIMRRGLVEVLGKHQHVVATLGPGGYFGEVCMILTFFLFLILILERLLYHQDFNRDERR